MNNGQSQQYQRGPPPPQKQDLYDQYPQGPARAQPPSQNRRYDQRPPPQRPPQRAPQWPQQQQQLPLQASQSQPRYYTQQQPIHGNGRPQEHAQQQVMPLNGAQQEYTQNYNNYDDGYYEEEQPHQEQRYGQRQQQNSEQSYDRKYQYDERYRVNGQQGPLQRPQQDHRGPMPQRDDQRTSYEASQRPRDRQRILQDQDPSPTSVPWDNPFGAFPTKKAPMQGDSDKSQESRSANRNALSQGSSDGRPRTSHANRPTSDSIPTTSHAGRPTSDGRPTTSHASRPPGHQSQRLVADTHRVSDADAQRRHQNNAPDRQDIPRPTLGNESWQDPGPRSAPQRTMTEPVLEHRYDEYEQQRRYDAPQPGIVRQQTHNTYDEAMQYNGRYQQQHSQSARQPFPDPQSQSHSHSMSDDYHHQGLLDYEPQPYPNVSSQANLATAAPPLPRVVSPPNNSTFEIPNFDNMTHNSNEDQLHPAQVTGPAQVYRKPVYERSEPPRQHVQATSSHPETLISPLSEFSFDLPQSDPPPVSSQVSDQRDAHYNGLPYQDSATINHLPSNVGQVQHPPRSASRGNMRPPPRAQNNEPPMPQSGTASRQQSYDQYATPPPGAQSSRAYQDHYGRDYERPPGAGPLRPPPAREPSRTGYDPRLQSGMNEMLSNGQLPPGPPQRPQTSNSTQFPVAGDVRRISSDSYQPSIRSQPDLSSRPVPFRPGLSQPPPQPPPAVAPAAASQTQGQIQTPVSQRDGKEPPITTQELNLLRQNYQNNPDDHKLGLRFAKRLVEAAKVLPNENGRTDPKQTAKNRERYILDSHKVVKKLIQAGYTDAMFYMADCYGQGALGLQPDSKEAFMLYQSAAKLGHAQAAYRVAVCCELGPEDGGGTRRDPLKAVQWYKRAASLGDPPAMYKMGMIQLKGLLGQPRSPREAISWLKRAAERADAENPHALHELGLLYESAQPNDAAVRDEKYAFELFTQAAELGYKYSQFRLGSAWEYGLLGCPIDPRMSIAWYSRAAAQGEHQSEFALSGWYLTGGGPAMPGQPPLLEQSDTEAYLWARKAAAAGLAKAEYAMGYYTEVGIGVTPNVEEAKKWYFRAAAQNLPKARERLEDLRKGGARMQKTRVSRSNVGKQNEGECVVM